MYADEKVSGISVNTKQYEEKEQIMSRIHFVILTWNSEKVIGQCLASMMKFREFEVNVCIVDNGSQDRTVDVVEQLSLIHIYFSFPVFLLLPVHSKPTSL